MEELTKKQRTLAQNRALHKLFDMVSKECANNGVTVEMILSERPEIPVTPRFVKEVWRDMQYQMLGKLSTRDLNTKDIDEVFEPFAMLCARLGIEMHFPSFEELMLRDLTK